MSRSAKEPAALSHPGKHGEGRPLDNSPVWFARRVGGASMCGWNLGLMRKAGMGPGHTHTPLIFQD